jgi:hypothetical protein
VAATVHSIAAEDRDAMARLRKGETVGWPVGGLALIADLQGRAQASRFATPEEHAASG